MAALSPATSNHGTASIHPLTAATATNASRNLRGLNKPKCIQCGNVARSRCPFQSCKSCCAKAQNPCHIHVLKSNAAFPDKTTSPSSADHQSNEASPSGNPHRFTSLRQLSNNFAQFNNLQSPLRSKKPLTRKEAAIINEWRFLKLKEYKESNTHIENGAFERYMQNVGLLEEVLAVNSSEKEPTTDANNVDSAAEDNGGDFALAGVKLTMRSNPARTELLRKRLGDIVNEGLRKLRKVDKKSSVVGAILNKQDEQPIGKQEKRNSEWAERTLLYNDLLDKLNKSRNEEDLSCCSEIASQLFQKQQLKSSSPMETEEDTEKQENEVVPVQPQPDYSPPKWYSVGTVDQDDLNRIDEGVPWAEKIEML